VTAATPAVRLQLPALAENVAVVRQALTGIADALALEGTLLADMKMAVSEACTNVVLHAYGHDGGELDVELFADEDGVEVVVSDTGMGIRPRPAPFSQGEEPVPGEDGALGLGLPLMAALSDDFEVRAGRDGGTVVRMRFSAHGDRDGRIIDGP
jgi:anti-sigma regulatory factor (Ser/Thr protein kinase)